MRHTFAVTTMLEAYHSGADPALVLPILSTWLGHAEPSDSYWYLIAHPGTARRGRRPARPPRQEAAMTSLAPTLQAYFMIYLV
ncbi:site-specific integrase [Georgenia subflava]|uniref:Tyrosine-type recombinase/integrase n=1 Tax=Georgenia subflava TaxID=1622177 RepID=A0A6N7EQD8_9MICO|nr:hypothetical protein [Georgenia subflava]MPV38356.1 hypothetical protein [Georgenia subflava]